MKYREDKISKNKLSALGLGCMRFPRDKAETERMILAAIDGGVNFFDTAYLYPGSEKTLGEILAKHDRRKDVLIGTKLPLMLCKGAADFDRIFSEQLRRLRTDYIDYYFMHNLTDFGQWEAVQKMGIEDWIAKKKAAGQIRQIGFSYHGTCTDFLKILDSYAWEFCMIQYNYYDEDYQAGRAGLRAAEAKGIPVIIMEPLLGGTLATGLPSQAVEMFAKCNPDLSPADWAFWWLWNQSGVTTVLSGMNSTQIMEENLRSVSNFRPLTEAELAAYADVVEQLKKAHKINCTSCNYCLPCPKGINIPACFSAYNASYGHGWMKGMTLYVTSTGIVKKRPNSPRNCIDCGKCEEVCPQYIPIVKSLKKVAARFEPPPIRAVMALARRFVSK
ncbi:MAG: aldo/keto reductase [Clostridiales bacterium]|jgi:predicted aldo/keto reductase-like oxidoreductase|nr:aldo/keto reductase [Clostridiales bacterium]